MVRTWYSTGISTFPSISIKTLTISVFYRIFNRTSFTGYDQIQDQKTPRGYDYGSW